jgi:hypothetical protein
VLEKKKGEVEKVIKHVKGVVAYTVVRTADSGVSLTACRDRAAAVESVKIAAGWLKTNSPAGASALGLLEGETSVRFYEEWSRRADEPRGGTREGTLLESAPVGFLPAS